MLEDPSSVPNIHMAAHNDLKLQFQGIRGFPPTSAGMHVVDTQTGNTLTHIK